MLIQKKDNSPALGRIPAHEVEQAVLLRLTTFLDSPREILQLLDARGFSLAETNQIIAAAKLKSQLLAQASSQSKAEFLALAIDRIILEEDSLDIRVNVFSLSNALLGKPTLPLPSETTSTTRPEGKALSLACNLHPKRSRGDLRQVFAAGQQPVSRPSIPLIKAIVRANSWFERLVSGEISTLEDLASETGFTKRYISRTLRGAFLAPDLTEMILDGLQGPNFTVRKLMDGFPADWPSQRAALKG